MGEIVVVSIDELENNHAINSIVTFEGHKQRYINGGWYNGRQYFDGKFGDPGVILAINGKRLKGGEK